MSPRSSIRPLSMLLSLFVLAAAVGAIASPPASSLRTPSETPIPDGWWAVVTANDVYLRSAPSVESSYPYAAFARGTVVRIVEESFGWARVAAVGPAFKDRFGYIKADRRVRLSDDGKSAEITARTDVLAPNLAARNSPDTSWKAIARLEPGTRVTVLGTVEGQREIVHSVPLPIDAEGWINLSFLRRATADEIRAVDPAAARETTATPPQPTREHDAPTPPSDRGDTRGASPTTPPNEASERPTRPTPARPATEEPANDRADDRINEADGEVATEGRDAALADRAVTPPAPPPVPRILLADIERAFERLTREDPATAEVTALRQRYLAYADETGVVAAERDFALGRAEQLAMRERVQARLQEARQLRARSDVDLEQIRSTRTAMDARRAYIAVGRLNASSVYDGVRLPLLFRLQDPSGGQTIGYLQPGRDGREFDLSSLLGQLVGIVGSRTYDEGLRVNIIVPTRIDVLTGTR